MHKNQNYQKEDRINNVIFIEDVVFTPRRTSKFRCSCGKEFIAKMYYVKRGNTLSCGCLISKAQIKHGETKNGKVTKEYACWSKIIQRCNNPNSTGYKNYGGRGITICERWLKFENFFEDMGRKPNNNHSIERIDVNGNYCPENCKWIPSIDQYKNRTDSRYITFQGETMILFEWAKILNINGNVLGNRIKRWGVEKAFITPLRYKKKNYEN